MSLGDETYKVFVNAKGNRAQLSHEMSAFLDYLLDRRADSDLTFAIQDEINTALYGGRWETEYMTMRMKIQEERAEAKEEGREEGREEGIEIGMEKGREEGIEIGMEKGMEKGRAEGMEKGILHSLISLVKDDLLDLSTAADRLNMTIDEFRAAMAAASSPQ